MLTKFRYVLTCFFINLAIKIVDKKTLEGLALLIAIKDWVDSIEEIKEKKDAN